MIIYEKKRRKNMFCTNCGSKIDDNSNFCPECGSQAARNEQPVQQPVQNYCDESNGGTSAKPIAERLVSALRSSLFMTVCILITAKAVLGLFAKSLPVMDILFCIFFWLTYTTALKGSPAEDKIRLISGTTFACEVLGYVGAGFIAIAGFLWTSVVSLLSSAALYGNYGSAAWSRIQQYFNYYGVNGYAALSGVIIAVCIVIAVILFLIIFFGWRNIHKFVQSVYQSVQQGRILITKRSTAQIWLMIFGILNAISFVSAIAGSNLVSALANGCGAASFIILSIMIGSNFGDYK